MWANTGTGNCPASSVAPLHWSYGKHRTRTRGSTSSTSLPVPSLRWNTICMLETLLSQSLSHADPTNAYISVHYIWTQSSTGAWKDNKIMPQLHCIVHYLTFLWNTLMHTHRRTWTLRLQHKYKTRQALRRSQFRRRRTWTSCTVCLCLFLKHMARAETFLPLPVRASRLLMERCTQQMCFICECSALCTAEREYWQRGCYWDCSIHVCG